jgi:hypothetical protein
MEYKHIKKDHPNQVANGRNKKGKENMNDFASPKAAAPLPFESEASESHIARRHKRFNVTE